VNPVEVDPGAWADGWIRIAQSPGFYVLAGLVALAILAWGYRGKKDRG
jgi:hypothetical protein